MSFCSTDHARRKFRKEKTGWFREELKSKNNDVVPVIFPEEVEYINTMYAEELSKL